MHLYKHTQIGYLIIVSLGLMVSVLLVGTFVFNEWSGFFLIGCIFFAVLLGIFSTLTVQVTPDALRIHFGPIPLCKKTWPLADMHSVQRVRNSFIHGWGIHYTPDGWVYNVSGYDAVEMVKKDGKTFRIGTDDPSGLHQSLSSKLS